MFLFLSVLKGKQKKIIFPSINVKDISPLASLLSPKDLVISISLVCLLAQISDSLKGILDFKDIQRLPSVKFYSKVLMFNSSTNRLSTVFSIAKTLGPELETLVLLSVNERFNYLNNLTEVVINEKVTGRLGSENKIFNDPFELMKYRRGLSLQTRSTLLATAIFLPHSLVLGLSVSQIDFEVIIDSCRSLWLFWGLDLEDFDFLLRKEAFIELKNIKDNFVFREPLSCFDSLKVIMFSLFKNFLSFQNELFFDDNVVLRYDNNIVPLENLLGFIKRFIPFLPKEINLSNSDLRDNLVRLALEQRKERIFNLENMHIISNRFKK